MPPINVLSPNGYITPISDEHLEEAISHGFKPYDGPSVELLDAQNNVRRVPESEVEVHINKGLKPVGFQSEDEKTSKPASAALAGVQGLTFGTSDEIEAKARSLVSPRSYEDLVAEVRSRYGKAKEDNPLTYTAAEMAGTLGSASLGSSIVGKAATKVAPALADLMTSNAFTRGVLKPTLEAGVVGGITGYGLSEGKDAETTAYDVGAGIGGGAALGGTLGATQFALQTAPKISNAARMGKIAYEAGREGIGTVSKEAQKLRASELVNKADQFMEKQRGLLEATGEHLGKSSESFDIKNPAVMDAPDMQKIISDKITRLERSYNTTKDPRKKQELSSLINTLKDYSLGEETTVTTPQLVFPEHGENEIRSMAENTLKRYAEAKNIKNPIVKEENGILKLYDKASDIPSEEEVTKNLLRDAEKRDIINPKIVKENNLLKVYSNDDGEYKLFKTVDLNKVLTQPSDKLVKTIDLVEQFKNTKPVMQNVTENLGRVKTGPRGSELLNDFRDYLAGDLKGAVPESKAVLREKKQLLNQVLNAIRSKDADYAAASEGYRQAKNIPEYINTDLVNPEYQATALNEAMSIGKTAQSEAIGVGAPSMDSYVRMNAARESLLKIRENTQNPAIIKAVDEQLAAFDQLKQQAGITGVANAASATPFGVSRLAIQGSNIASNVAGQLVKGASDASTFVIKKLPETAQSIISNVGKLSNVTPGVVGGAVASGLNAMMTQTGYYDPSDREINDIINQITPEMGNAGKDMVERLKYIQTADPTKRQAMLYVIKSTPSFKKLMSKPNER